MKKIAPRAHERRAPALLVLLAAFCFAAAQEASAQGAQGAPPPTYDYNASVPGTQPPASPLVANHEFRSVRLYQLSVPVLVPLAELQAALPPGFVPVATPANSGAATVTLMFIYQQRFERTTVNQSFGPFSGVLVSTTILNTTVTPARQEILFPAFEVSDWVGPLNDSFGPGAARQANVKVDISEKDGTLRMKFDVHDAASGFKVKAQAESTVDINTRSISDPIGLPFRTLGGLTPNEAFRGASQSDTLSVPATAALAQVDAPAGRLRLPGGDVTILGLGANVSFSRNVEFFLKFE
ncbi:MAG TPA: hypothetical protein VM914_11600 [Pyrinomonadaceae bacterium]|jgi:hypothetical protein|nr:hypothetical protein [Pyrinomonadaceae bacterium]